MACGPLALPQVYGAGRIISQSRQTRNASPGSPLKRCGFIAAFSLDPRAPGISSSGGVSMRQKQIAAAKGDPIRAQLYVNEYDRRARS